MKGSRTSRNTGSPRARCPARHQLSMAGVARPAPARVLRRAAVLPRREEQAAHGQQPASSPVGIPDGRNAALTRRAAARSERVYAHYSAWCKAERALPTVGEQVRGGSVPGLPRRSRRTRRIRGRGGFRRISRPGGKRGAVQDLRRWSALLIAVRVGRVGRVRPFNLCSTATPRGGYACSASQSQRPDGNYRWNSANPANPDTTSTPLAADRGPTSRCSKSEPPPVAAGVDPRFDEPFPGRPWRAPCRRAAARCPLPAC